MASVIHNPWNKVKKGHTLCTEWKHLWNQNMSITNDNIIIQIGVLPEKVKITEVYFNNVALMNTCFEHAYPYGSSMKSNFVKILGGYDVLPIFLCYSFHHIPVQPWQWQFHCSIVWCPFPLPIHSRASQSKRWFFSLIVDSLRQFQFLESDAGTGFLQSCHQNLIELQANVVGILEYRQQAKEKANWHSVFNTK